MLIVFDSFHMFYMFSYVLVWFHGLVGPPAAIFEKKHNLQNQERHFLKMACNPILIRDPEST